VTVAIAPAMKPKIMLLSEVPDIGVSLIVFLARFEP
jgi:energy-converting hydrogenase Eha subunit E